VKVLLVDEKRDRTRSVEGALTALGVTDILRLQPGDSIPDAVARVLPDLVIVDMSRPDRDTLDDIRRSTNTAPRPVAMFVDVDDPAFMEEAIEAGVSSYTVVGGNLPDVKPIMRAAVAIFRRFRQKEAELHQAQAGLRDREMVDAAKRFLVTRRGMSEPEAHRWLRRKAMDQSRRLSDVAAEVLGQASGGTKPHG
jgi:response regulator NasT